MTHEKTEKPAYKDVKVSTLLKNIENYLKEQTLKNISVYEFDSEVVDHINDYLNANQYPICCWWRDGYELRSVELDTAADEMMDKNREKAYNIRSCALLCEILVRTSRDRKNQTKTFKSILKSGPSFDLKVSDLIKRRKKGYSLDADSVLREISQAGYDSPQEMMDAYTKATKLAEDLRWIAFRYEKLSEYEKELLSQD